MLPPSLTIVAGMQTDPPSSLNPRRISAAGWRIVLLASLGGTLEFYDFVIFGIFAKDIADAVFPIRRRSSP
jgi:MFS transporter, MHS family, proline/betaine transporter